MRFKRLDLNLLVALDVLLTEKNVSRAAERLFLSQSATSGALARLREYFGDDLLVQVGRKMVLTPRAQALSGKVRAVLMQIDGTIIQPPEFDPATVERTIRIVVSDYVLMAVMNQALREINRLAPNLTIILDPPSIDPAKALSQGDVDLLAMPEVYIAPDHPSEHYFSDDYVVIACAANSRLTDSITRDQFFDTRHVTMRFASHQLSFENWFTRNTGVDRKFAAVAGSFAAVPFLISGTDNIALIQRRLAHVFNRIVPLKILESPIDIPPLVEHLQWHAFSEGDDCIAWVRQKIIALQPGL